MDHEHDLVQKQFANVAANYATSSVHSSGKDLDAMIACVELHGNERILDAGCGSGHTSARFAPHVAQVTAYDLTQEMLDETQKLIRLRGLSNVVARRGDVERLRFEPTAFDLIVSRYSGHHWLNPQIAINEFARVLKPGGHFILSDTIAPDDLMLDTYLQTIELLRDPSHIRDHSIRQWQEMLNMAGFTSEVILDFNVTLDFSTWVKRMATPEINTLAIKAMFDQCPNKVRALFHLMDEWNEMDTFDFVIPGAVILATI
jgi:ubiquinone/menaquinone biosynthesis C-methylase UbiE